MHNFRCICRKLYLVAHTIKSHRCHISWQDESMQMTHRPVVAVQSVSDIVLILECVAKDHSKEPAGKCHCCNC